ncbi:class I SAM-dependent methyltransferase [Candidatus Woesearchaeota archaeon]|nr:class I SAM-dependent methyltransferase [Candidatus Woesearchaeota archaeon]
MVILGSGSEDHITGDFSHIIRSISQIRYYFFGSHVTIAKKSVDPIKGKPYIGGWTTRKEWKTDPNTKRTTFFGHPVRTMEESRLLQTELLTKDIEVIQLNQFTGELTDQAWDDWTYVMESEGINATHDIIINVLKDIVFESILDVGCGNGALLSKLRVKYPHRRLIGIERNAKLTDSSCEKDMIIQADIKSIDKSVKEQFDLINFCAILEPNVLSPENAKAVFDKACDILNPRGTVLIASVCGSYIDTEYLEKKGFQVRNKVVPENVFKIGKEHGARQLYIAQKY